MNKLTQEQVEEIIDIKFLYNGDLGRLQHGIQHRFEILHKMKYMIEPQVYTSVRNKLYSYFTEEIGKVFYNPTSYIV